MTLHRAYIVLLMAVASLTGNARAASATAMQTETPGCLRLGADVSLGDSIRQFSALFENLYGRIGRCVVSVPMPPKRIEQLMASGELDADWFRPSEFIKIRNLNHLAVKQPIFAMEAHILWLDETRFSGNPEDMAGRTVGHRDGYRWLERHIPLMGGRPFPISNSSQVKRLLLLGRIDLYATSSVNEPLIRQQFTTDDPLLNSTYWDTVSFQHILHPKHQSLVLPLEQALTQMIEEGEIDGYLAKAGAKKPAMAE